MGTSTGDAKIERLLNLVLALLATRRPLSKETLRRQVRQYEQFDDELFDRMFERDKDELRELGIPLVTEPLDVLFDDEVGYRIDRRAYALPPIRFTAAEVEALGFASRAWAESSLAPKATAAIRKLSAAGAQAEDAVLDGAAATDRFVEMDEFMVSTAVPSFEVIHQAVMKRRTITFDYRRSDGSSGARRLQPWRLQAWHGNWYVTGWDLDRESARLFRLDRITSAVKASGRAGAYEIPADHDPMTMIRRRVDPGAGGVATLLVARRAGAALRLRAQERPVDVAPDAPAVPKVPGFDAVRVEFDDPGEMARDVASYGADVIVVDPRSLAVRVQGLLRGAAMAGLGGEAR